MTFFFYRDASTLTSFDQRGSSLLRVCSAAPVHQDGRMGYYTRMRDAVTT